jgi:TolB-like protein/cytochrome c-type biogenesis protein CcmH/NrfG
MSEETQRRLTTIVAADIVGFSRLVGVDEEGALAAQRAHRAELIEPLLAKYHGRIANTAGDSFLLEFPSAVEAVRCAVAVQEGIAERNLNVTADRRIAYRVGINVGDVVADGEDLLGDGVNVAARLEALCKPGGIVLSDDAYRQIRDRLELRWEDGGEREVKNIARPIQVWHWSTAAEVDTPVSEAAETSEPPPLPDRPSVAVLPFDNMSGDPEQEYFADGITEDIITDLSKVSGLFVIARNSSFAFKGRAENLKQVARELGVRYIAEGSVRKAGDRVRINAQLIDPDSGDHLWAERYDGDMEDIFALQDRITESIVATLAITLTRVEQDRAMRNRPDNLRAYDFVLRGNAFHHRLTKEDNVRAREMYARAIELDPEYAPAYAGLAWVLVHDANQRWSEDPKNSMDTAFENAKMAVALDDSLAKGHTVLADVYLWTRRHEQAVIEGRKAITLDPSYADGHFALAVYLYMSGFAEEAVEEAQKALRFNPVHAHRLYYNALSRSHYLLEQYEQAAAAAEQCVNLDPDQYGSHLALAVAYAQLNRTDDARRHAQEALRINPQFTVQSYADFVPIKNQADLDHMLDGLRKAGLPE